MHAVVRGIMAFNHLDKVFSCSIYVIVGIRACIRCILFPVNFHLYVLFYLISIMLLYIVYTYLFAYIPIYSPLFLHIFKLLIY